MKREKPLEDMTPDEIASMLDDMVKDGTIEEGPRAPNGERSWRLTEKGKRYVENNLLKLPNA